MKKILALSLMTALALAGCSSKKEPSAKLQASSPAYALAQSLTGTLPALNPETTVVLVKAENFVVTAGEVIQMFLDTMGNGAQEMKSLAAARLKQVLEQAAVQVAEQKLLLAAAARAKVGLKPEEVKIALESQYAQAGGEDKFLETLKANNVNLEDFKKRIADNLTIQKYLQDALAASGQVTEDEVKKAYAEDKTATVRHILLKTEGKSAAEKAEIRKKLEGLLARARAGEDFAGLAKQYSEDPGSKDNGGLYDGFGRGKMVKPFEDAAFSVPVGQVSDIVETDFGYHILKVENRVKETQPFDQVKSQLESDLKDRKEQTGFEILMAKLKDEAKFTVLGFGR
jgi:parvulin-like peptidyl-prolyl isomerase